MSTFSFPGQTAFYSGKVRDVYTIENDLLVMLASNRISAFDVILPRTIPYKGQVLNQIAAYMLRATKDICPNWLIDVPAPNASFGKRCEPFKIESLLRESGIKEILVHGQQFPYEFCDDCGAPLYPNIEGDSVHAEMPEQNNAPSQTLH